jgi:hypothetical protein
VHSGFVTPKNDAAFGNMSEGWKKVVGRIGAISGEQTGKGTPYPETGDTAKTWK